MKTDHVIYSILLSSFQRIQIMYFRSIRLCYLITYYSVTSVLVDLLSWRCGLVKNPRYKVVLVTIWSFMKHSCRLDLQYPVCFYFAILQYPVLWLNNFCCSIVYHFPQTFMYSNISLTFLLGFMLQCQTVDPIQYPTLFLFAADMSFSVLCSNISLLSMCCEVLDLDPFTEVREFNIVVIHKAFT